MFLSKIEPLSLFLSVFIHISVVYYNSAFACHIFLSPNKNISCHRVEVAHSHSQDVGDRLHVLVHGLGGSGGIGDQGEDGARGDDGGLRDGPY